MRYDPEAGPDLRAWLELDEGERLEIVLRHHKRAKAKAGNPRLHAAIHVTIENQLAEGHAGARAALERLLKEGLDRHEGLHALGTVLAGHLHRIARNKEFDVGQYERELTELTIESWHRMAEGE